MKRNFLVGGNWKCNGSKEFILKWIEEINQTKFIQKENIEIIIFPPFIYLDFMKNVLPKNMEIGAQNCYYEPKGAFTGEISSIMLKDLEIPWVIIGHSERRDIFKESDELIGKKIESALNAGLKVIFCIGEHIEERENGKTEEVIFKQLKIVSNFVKDWSNIVIAYEPVWAIGTGKTATPEMAQEVHAAIRNWIKKNINLTTADSIRILYGGSVKGNNAFDLAKKEDIDGFLVGGASLITSEFISIINSVSAKF